MRFNRAASPVNMQSHPFDSLHSLRAGKSQRHNVTSEDAQSAWRIAHGEISAASPMDIPKYSKMVFVEFLGAIRVFFTVYEPDFSTTLALRAVDRYLNSRDTYNLRMLDLGCGTGTVGILAAKRGVKRVLATDIDDCAIENTYYNVQRFGFSEIIEVRKSNLFDNINELFDLIVFNVPPNFVHITERFAIEVHKYLDKDGTIILCWPNDYQTQTFDGEIWTQEQLEEIVGKYGYKVKLLESIVLREDYYNHASYQLIPEYSDNSVLVVSSVTESDRSSSPVIREKLPLFVSLNAGRLLNEAQETFRLIDTIWQKR